MARAGADQLTAGPAKTERSLARLVERQALQEGLTAEVWAVAKAEEAVSAAS